MDHQETIVPRLVMALRHLTLPAPDQVAYLHGLGTAPSVDELALELDDVLGLVPEAIRSGSLSAQQADAVRAVVDRLDAFSGAGHEDLWDVSALSVAAEWQDVRRLSALALQTLDQAADDHHGGS